MDCFVKPANLGSSVGINRVESEGEFTRAIDEALEFDRKVIIEETITGRELECSVLGNQHPVASLPGEVIHNSKKHRFYSYEAKYLDEKGAVLEIPARLGEATTREIRDMAVRVFQLLCCEGLARVDFFLRPDGGLLVNEINTIPGFTRISMYPKLWEASGKTYTQLITELINLAMQRFEEEKALRTSV